MSRLPTPTLKTAWLVASLICAGAFAANQASKPRMSKGREILRCLDFIDSFHLIEHSELRLCHLDESYWSLRRLIMNVQNRVSQNSSSSSSGCISCETSSRHTARIACSTPAAFNLSVTGLFSLFNSGKARSNMARSRQSRSEERRVGKVD